MLSVKVAWEMHKAWMVKVDFFDRAEKPFLARLALAMCEEIYAPSERPPIGRLYVIYKGVCRYGGKTLLTGTHFGSEDVLLRNNYSPRPTAVAIGYLHVHHISRATIEGLLGGGDTFPQAYTSMRQWIIWRALKDYLISVARQQARARKSIRSIKDHAEAVPLPPPLPSSSFRTASPGPLEA